MTHLLQDIGGIRSLQAQLEEPGSKLIGLYANQLATSFAFQCRTEILPIASRRSRRLLARRIEVADQEQEVA